MDSEYKDVLQTMAEKALQFCFDHADDTQLCSLVGVLVKGMEELCVKARIVAGGYSDKQAASLIMQAQQLQMKQQAEILRNSSPQIMAQPLYGAAGGSSHG